MEANDQGKILSLLRTRRLRRRETERLTREGEDEERRRKKTGPLGIIQKMESIMGGGEKRRSFSSAATFCGEKREALKGSRRGSQLGLKTHVCFRPGKADWLQFIKERREPGMQAGQGGQERKGRKKNASGGEGDSRLRKKGSLVHWRLRTRCVHMPKKA